MIEKIKIITRIIRHWQKKILLPPPLPARLHSTSLRPRKRYWIQRDIAWDRYRGTRHPTSRCIYIYILLSNCIGKYVSAFFLCQCLSPSPSPTVTLLFTLCSNFDSIIIISFFIFIVKFIHDSLSALLYAFMIVSFFFFHEIAKKIINFIINK